MENKINIVELLKDCPTGMELDCTMYNKVTLLNVDTDDTIFFPISVVRKDGNIIKLTKYGQYSNVDFAKCIIFPKGKTTWEGFQIPFKDGDIVTTSSGIQIFILQRAKSNTKGYCYMGYDFEFNKFFMANEWEFDRLATEEEKENLFQAIKDNGYRWDEGTKTLEKLTSKFKDGDVVAAGYSESTQLFLLKHLTHCKDGNINTGYCYFGWDFYYNRLIEEGNWGFCRLATEEEKEKLFDTIKANGYKWNDANKTLEKLTPKFKVGNKIKLKGGDEFGIITQVADSFYTIKCKNNTHYWSIKKQDDWELVPNKFDINSLIPFESRVLVRDIDHYEWEGAIFGRYDGNSFFTIGGTDWKYCIPYEGNEHLLGTTDDCDEYFKLFS